MNGTCILSETLVLPGAPCCTELHAGWAERVAPCTCAIHPLAHQLTVCPTSCAPPAAAMAAKLTGLEAGGHLRLRDARTANNRTAWNASLSDGRIEGKSGCRC